MKSGTMDDSSPMSGQSALSNEWSLYNSYTESLEHVLKIEKELSSLRENSANKLSTLIGVEKFGDDRRCRKKHRGVSDDGKEENTLQTRSSPPSYEAKYYSHSLRKELAKIFNARHSEKFECNLRNEICSDSNHSMSQFLSQLKDESFTSSLVEINNTPCLLDMDNISNFSEKLNNLYAHLIKQYIRDEKLLSKYFEVMYNVREKAALSMAKNELIRLKNKKTHAHDQSSSTFKKKQRALLVKLYHEYNEIMFMKSFQRKLSDDRRKTLVRQLKHFRTMFAYNPNKKNIERWHLKKSNHAYKTKPEKSPVKCYNICIKENEDQKDDTFATCHRKRLNNLLQLHLDLEINSAQLDSIEKIHSNSEIVSTLKTSGKQSTEEIGELKMMDSIDICDQSESCNERLSELPANDLNLQIRAVTESIDSSDVELKKIPLHCDILQPFASPAPLLKHTKENRNVDDVNHDNPKLVPMLNYPMIRLTSSYTLQCALNDLPEINDYLAIFKRMFNVVSAYCARMELNSTAVQFQNALERIFILQNLIRNVNSKSVVFVGSDNISCLLRTILQVTFTNFDLSSLADKKLLSIIKRNYLKLNKRYFKCGLDYCMNMSYSIKPSDKIIKCNNLCSDVSLKKFIAPDAKYQEDPLKDCNFSTTNEITDSDNKDVHKSVNDDASSKTDANNSKGAGNKCYQNEEAEELRKKQLAVEMEIKALLEQRQPYFVVREIPDKPPPPYTAPPSPPLSDETRVSTGTSTDRRPEDDDDASPIRFDRVGGVARLCHERVWRPYLASQERRSPEGFRRACELTRTEPSAGHQFLVDLCHEVFHAEYGLSTTGRRVDAWEFGADRREFDREDVPARVERLAERYLHYDAAAPRDGAFVNCAHKLQDRVDELLVAELRDEEPEWVCVDGHEAAIKNALAECILDAMVADTVRECRRLYEGVAA